VQLRLVTGHENEDNGARPYASSKPHVDLWSGEPADHVNIIIPLFGDIERTTVHFFHPPDTMEFDAMRVMTDYGQGGQHLGNCQPYPVVPRLGWACFADAIVPHRTVRQGGRLRGSMQIAVRRVVSDEERREVEATCVPGRLDSYTSPQEWYALGTTHRMRFSDTLESARRGQFSDRPYDERFYSVEERARPASDAFLLELA